MENSTRYDSTLLVIALSVIGFNLFLTPSIEQKTIFQSKKEIVSTPSAYGLSHQEIFLPSKTGKIQSWYINNPNSKRVAIFFHGNSRNIGAFGNLYKNIYKTPSDLLIVEYPGYGKSEGTPSEDGVYQAAERAYQYLLNKGYTSDNIYLIGYSLGGAVATHLATKKKVAALLLISPISSVSDTVNSKFSVLSLLFWTRSKFDTYNMVKKVNTPVMILHSKKDKNCQ